MPLVLLIATVQACEECYECPPTTVNEITELTEVTNQYSSGGGHKNAIYKAFRGAVSYLKDEQTGWFKTTSYNELGDLVDSYFASDKDIDTLKARLNYLERKVAELEKREYQIINKSVYYPTEHIHTEVNKTVYRDQYFWLALLIIAIVLAIDHLVWRRRLNK